MQSLIVKGENVLPFVLCVVLLFLIMMLMSLEASFLEHSFVPLVLSVLVIFPIYLLIYKFAKDKFYSRISQKKLLPIF